MMPALPLFFLAGTLCLIAALSIAVAARPTLKAIRAKGKIP